MPPSLTQQIHAGLIAAGQMQVAPPPLKSARAFMLPMGSPSYRPDDCGVLFRFDHGLGDCVCLSHQIPLYTRRGHVIEVCCQPQFRALFEAAGAKIVVDDPGAPGHRWFHPAHACAPAGNWLALNKPWANVSAWPLPYIGRDEALWREYLDVRLDFEPFVPDDTRRRVEQFLGGLSRPIVLFHPVGGQPVEMRALPGKVQADFLKAMASGPGTVIVLEGSGFRVQGSGRKPSASAAFNPSPVTCNLGSLYCLLKLADLFVGVDSGPAHFMRLTDTPAIVCWREQQYPLGRPQWCAMPRHETINLVADVKHCPTEFNAQGYDETNGKSLAAVVKSALQKSNPGLRLCRDRGLAYQIDRSRPVVYGDDYWNEYIRRSRTPLGRELTRLRLELVGRHIPASSRLLDVGIGCGQFLEAAAAAGYQVAGDDVNPRALEWLRVRGWLAEEVTGYRLQGTASASAGCYLSLTLWDVLEHLPDPVRLLKRVPEGKYVFLSLPIFNSVDDVPKSKHYKPNEHFWYFTDEGLRRFMGEHGFECLEANDAETKAGREGICSYVFRKSSPHPLSVAATALAEIEQFDDAIRAPFNRATLPTTVSCKPAKPADFGGPHQCFQFLVPAGIGDIAWVYSKLRWLKTVSHREVIVYCPGGDAPRRGGDLVELLPEVHWGGYYGAGGSWEVLSQTLPSTWPPKMGTWEFLCRPKVQHLSANLHLEAGGKLADWLPCLPIDYHWAVKFSDEHRAAARELLAPIRPAPGQSATLFAVYTSGSDKDALKGGGWALWNAQTWVDFLAAVARLPGCANAGFVLLGAEYDRDKTQAVARGLRAKSLPAAECIAQPLGVALMCLHAADYCFSFPSGIGIMANVLWVPCLMQLPWCLSPLAESFADPRDIAEGRYRAWPGVRPAEALEWLRETLPMSLEYSGWRREVKKEVRG